MNNILIVETNHRLNPALIESLQDKWHITLCPSVEQALYEIKYKPGLYSAVITNWGKNALGSVGERILKAVRGTCPHVPVIVTFANENERAQILGFGPNEIIQRPFTATDLSLVIAKALSKNPVRETKQIPTKAPEFVTA